MKTIKYFFCILLLIFTSRIYSQVPDTIWTKTFGGPLSDVGVSVKQTKDDGFIIAATTSSFGAGGQDIYLIKTDENGDTLWTKTFGGTGNDRAANVVQTNDNGYAVFGTTNSFGNGGDDFLLWKADSLGNTEWYKMYGGSFNDICTEGKQTSDGGFITTGYFYNQVVRSTVIKIDGFGNERWNKTLKVSNYSDLWSYSVEQAFNDNYFIGIFLPIETSGEGDVNAHSRVQMALGEAKAKAKLEYKECLEKTGYSIEEIKAYVETHDELQRPFFHVSHRKGISGVGANFILDVAEIMKKEGINSHKNIEEIVFV